MEFRCVEMVEETMYGHLRKNQMVKHWEGNTMNVDITRKIPPGEAVFERYVSGNPPAGEIRYATAGCEMMNSGGQSYASQVDALEPSSLAGMSALLSPSPALAHHAFAAEFDEKKPVKFVDATVTKVELINPHSWIHVDVKMPDGTVENWAIEAGKPEHSAAARHHQGYAQGGAED